MAWTRLKTKRRPALWDAHAPTAQVFNHGTLALSDPLDLKAPLHEDHRLARTCDATDSNEMQRC